ncbi:MAG: HAD family hydrolase [Phycisphaerales bacterium]
MTADNPRPRLRLFLFDIAGTTIRDDGWVLRAFLDAAASMGIAPDPEWVRARMGWSKRQVFEEMLVNARKDAAAAPVLLDAFSSSILARLDQSPPAPLPGAEAAIAAFREAGIKVGFTTGFGIVLAREIISRIGWSPDTLVGSDEVPAGRPAPDMIRLGMSRAGISDPRAVGVIGDTPADIAAGLAAGCGVVLGVAHGSHSRSELLDPPCDGVLDSLATLPEVLGVR